jgi:glycosyltransferase involved in cell wall biosynthesis
MPKLTVILTTYNRLNFLIKAVDSVLNQTFKDFQLLILDNASTDGTETYIKSIQDDRVFYIRNEQNIGALNNGNKAINLCRNSIESEYVSFFHDDDIMKPQLLETELDIFEKYEDVVLVATNQGIIDENDHVIKKKAMDIDQDIVFDRHQYIEDFFKKNIFLPCPSVMLRRKFLAENNFIFRPEVGPGADIFLWFEMNLLDGKFYLIHTPLLKYRLHPNQDSQLNFFDLTIAFHKNTEDFLKKNYLDHLLPLLKQRTSRILTTILSLRRSLKMMDKESFIEKASILKKEGIADKDLRLKYKIYLFLSRYFPVFLGFLYKAKRKTQILLNKQ